MQIPQSHLQKQQTRTENYVKKAQKSPWKMSYKGAYETSLKKCYKGS